MGSSSGYRVWRLDDEVGSLTVGKKADITIVDARKPHLYPATDPAVTVVMNAGPSDVETVIVAGQIVKANHTLVGGAAERARRLIEASHRRLMNGVETPATLSA